MGQSNFDNARPNAKTWPLPEADFAVRVPIPEHELLSCIGRGSYGNVWLARNSMGVYRAVKIVFRDSFDHQRPFERELSGIRKFEPISRLHDGFIDILQVGINEERGYFYYIMEAGDDECSGQTIHPEAYTPNTLASEIFRRDRLSLHECLQLGLALTAAVAELHKHGLVHRDIKPSNVIFVDGKPKLADIGLVAGVDEARSYVGTEGFIPPEGPGTTHADLYSLGKVLYEAATGKDRLDFPEMPTEWSQSPDYQPLLELNEVILLACKTDPKDRYRSAWDMHADLVVIVNGKSVKRLRVLERRMSQLKRLVGVAALILVVGGLLAFQVHRELRAATIERQRQVDGNVAHGIRAMEAGDFFEALPYFAKALWLDRGDPDHERMHRLRLGSTLAHCPKLTQMWCATGSVWDARISPDGKNVLWAEYFGEAEIHDLQTGQLYGRPFGPQAGLRSAVYSPDGKRILTSSEDASAIVWDAVSLSEVLLLPHPDKVYTGRFSADGRRIVTACSDGIARVWDANTGRLELELRPPHAARVASVAFSHDGQRIVTASHDNTARVWDAYSGEPVQEPFIHPSWVRCAVFSPDDRTVFTTCDDHRARAWEVATGRALQPELVHDDVVETVGFSPDGRLIVTASFDGTVRLWRAADRQPLGSNPILRHSDRVAHAAFSRDARQVITACFDGSVRVWDLASVMTPPPALHRVFCRDGSRFLAITTNRIDVCESSDAKVICRLASDGFTPRRALLNFDGSLILASLSPTDPSQTDDLIRVWSTETGQPLGPELSVAGSATDVCFSDDGEGIAASNGETTQLWDRHSEATASLSLSHNGPVTSAVFSPDASRLVTVSGANACVWNVQTGRAAYLPLSHPAPVVCIEFSRDGRFLVTCCANSAVTKCFARVWDVETGQPVTGPLWHRDGVLSASFSPDSTRLVTASEDFTAKVWDVNTGDQIGFALRHSGQVRSATFSPDGQWVATASADHTARLWDPQTGDPLTPPLQHLTAVSAVKFLPDGRRLVTGDDQGRTFEWRFSIDSRSPSELIEMAAFLGGGQASSRDAPTHLSGESQRTTWQSLRSKYPQDFAVSTKDVVRWHEFQAQASESEALWRSAAFHLECLLKLQPGKRAVEQDLARIQEKLNATGQP